MLTAVCRRLRCLQSSLSGSDRSPEGFQAGILPPASGPRHAELPGQAGAVSAGRRALAVGNGSGPDLAEAGDPDVFGARRRSL